MSQEKTDLQDNDPVASASGAETPEAGDNQAGVQADAGATTDEQQETPADASQAQTEDDHVTSLREALDKATEEANSYREQALRAVADAENARKRAQREVESARKFALEKFATELLGVRDSLEMGLKAGEETEADKEKLVEGMELTNRMLASAMEKFGIEIVNPEGETFNPEVHEAVSMQETDAQAANTVVSVVQKGYTLNGRVLRAAMVVVAKAPSGDS